jgi:hypothetical protein
MVLLGIAEGTASDASAVEVRFDRQDYERVERLSAPLQLTAIIDEGKSSQRTVIKQLKTSRNSSLRPGFRLRLAGSEFIEEAL